MISPVPHSQLKRPAHLKVVASASERLSSATSVAYACSTTDPQHEEKHDDEVDEEGCDHSEDVGDGRDDLSEERKVSFRRGKLRGAGVKERTHLLSLTREDDDRGKDQGDEGERGDGRQEFSLEELLRLDGDEEPAREERKSKRDACEMPPASVTASAKET